jgi:hypothetical protein
VSSSRRTLDSYYRKLEKPERRAKTEHQRQRQKLIEITYILINVRSSIHRSIEIVLTPSL